MKLGVLPLGFSSKTSFKCFLPSSRLLRLATAVRPWQFFQSMKNARRCRVCRRVFEVERRTEHRHFHCGGAACQRARRALAQKLRRRREAGSSKETASRRLQTRVTPPEAVDLTQNPLFIGLISMLIGSADFQAIRTASRRLFDRGRSILGLKATKTPEPVDHQGLAPTPNFPWRG